MAWVPANEVPDDLIEPGAPLPTPQPAQPEAAPPPEVVQDPAALPATSFPPALLAQPNVGELPAPEAAAWKPVDFDPFLEAPEVPGIGQVAQEALSRGAWEGAANMGSAFDPFTLPKTSGLPRSDYLETLLQTPVTEGWRNPSWFVAHILYPAAHAAPSLAMGAAGAAAGSRYGQYGALGGGAVGFGLGSAMQTIGPAYQKARADGLDHEAAVDRAMTQSGIAGAFGAAMGLAPGATLFGKTVDGALRRPLSEALAQVTVVQPSLALGQAQSQRMAEGKSLTADEAATVAAETLGLGVTIVGGAHGAMALSRKAADVLRGSGIRVEPLHPAGQGPEVSFEGEKLAPPRPGLPRPEEPWQAPGAPKEPPQPPTAGGGGAAPTPAEAGTLGQIESAAKRVLPHGVGNVRVFRDLGDITVPRGLAAGAGQSAFSAQAPEITHTPEFKQWFQGSQVADKAGSPVVMYRGSGHPNAEPHGGRGSGNFVFLSDRPQTAEIYARDGGQVFPVYVSARRIFDASRGEDLQLFKQFMAETGARPARGVTADGDSGAYPHWVDERPLREWLWKRGVPFDGIYFAENDGSRSLAVPNIEQIKSVNNTGRFDPENPDIMASLPEGGANVGRNAVREGLPTPSAAKQSSVAPVPEGVPDAAGNAGQGGDAGARRAVAGTETFDAPGFTGVVTGGKPGAGRTAKRTYRLYPEGIKVNRLTPVKKLGEPLAYADVSQHPDGRWEVDFVGSHVSGQRLSQRLYDAIERDIGMPMRPSGYLTREGYHAIWQKRNPDAVQWHRWSKYHGHYLSPLQVKRQLELVETNLATPGLNLKSEWAKSLPAERDELRRIWDSLPTEAQIGAQPDLMFSLPNEAPVASGGMPEARPRLAALHNLTADDLEKADALGGLAVPSIGVVKEGTGIHGFGEISLVGRIGLGDPAQNPVFDADAYTARFPRPNYKAAPTKKAQKLVDRLAPHAKRFSDTGNLQVLWDRLVETPEPERAVSLAEDSPSVRALFLKEKLGVDAKPVMAPAISPEDEFGFVFRPEFAEAAQTLRSAARGSLSPSDPALMPVNRAAKAALQKKLADDYAGYEDGGRIIADIMDRLFDDQGQMSYWAFNRTVAAVHDMDKTVVDRYATKDSLDAALAAHQDAFAAWVRNEIMPLYGEPRVEIGRRKAPWTLPNIVESMTSSRVKNEEKTLTVSEGQVRARASRQFEDVPAMRAMAGSYLADQPDVDAARADVQQKLEDFRNRAAEGYRYSDEWRSYDDAMRALGDLVGNRLRNGLTTSALRRALTKYNFGKLPQDVLDLGVEAARGLLEAPVPYFESKPQRGVSLGEFAGAAIPANASAKTREILAKHGILTREYDHTGGKQQENKAAAAAALARDLAATHGTLWALKGFYHPGHQAIEQFPQEVATAKQWKALLAPGKIPGVTKDWRDFVKVDRIIDQLAQREGSGGKVAKADLLNYVKAADIDLDLVTKWTVEKDPEAGGKLKYGDARKAELEATFSIAPVETLFQNDFFAILDELGRLENFMDAFNKAGLYSLDTRPTLADLKRADVKLESVKSETLHWHQRRYWLATAPDGTIAYVESQLGSARQAPSRDAAIHALKGEFSRLVDDQIARETRDLGILDENRDPERRTVFHEYSIPGATYVAELLVTSKQLEPYWTSQHFQSSELTHVRLGEIELPARQKGSRPRKALVVEEVQADFHAKGEEAGYADISEFEEDRKHREFMRRGEAEFNARKATADVLRDQDKQDLGRHLKKFNRESGLAPVPTGAVGEVILSWEQQVEDKEPPTKVPSGLEHRKFLVMAANVTNTPIQDMEKAINAFYESIPDYIFNGYVKQTEDWYRASEEKHEFIKQNRKKYTTDGKQVNAPYKDMLYVELGQKLALRFAVEHGYDAIILPTARMSGDAVGASKLDTVNWKLDGNDLIVTAKTYGEKATEKRLDGDPAGGHSKALAWIGRNFSPELAEALRYDIAQGATSGSSTDTLTPLPGLASRLRYPMPKDGFANLGMKLEYEQLAPGFLRKYAGARGAQLTEERIPEIQPVTLYSRLNDVYWQLATQSASVREGRKKILMDRTKEEVARMREREASGMDPFDALFDESVEEFPLNAPEGYDPVAGVEEEIREVMGQLEKHFKDAADKSHGRWLNNESYVNIPEERRNKFIAVEREIYDNLSEPLQRLVDATLPPLSLPILHITPELRASILAGQPLYALKGFYSAGRRAAENFQASATPAQWRALFRPGKVPGITQNWLEMTDIDAMLENYDPKAKVSREAVLAYIDATEAPVDEKWWGSASPDGYDAEGRAFVSDAHAQQMAQEAVNERESEFFRENSGVTMRPINGNELSMALDSMLDVDDYVEHVLRGFFMGEVENLTNREEDLAPIREYIEYVAKRAENNESAPNDLIQKMNDLTENLGRSFDFAAVSVYNQYMYENRIWGRINLISGNGAIAFWKSPDDDKATVATYEDVRDARITFEHEVEGQIEQDLPEISDGWLEQELENLGDSYQTGSAPRWGDYKIEGVNYLGEVQVTLPDQDWGSFSSPHFPGNDLIFLQLGERNEDLVLIADQSDVHQQGQKKGYASPAGLRAWNEAVEKQRQHADAYDALTKQIEDLGRELRKENRAMHNVYDTVEDEIRLWKKTHPEFKFDAEDVGFQIIDKWASDDNTFKTPAVQEFANAKYGVLGKEVKYRRDLIKSVSDRIRALQDEQEALGASAPPEPGDRPTIPDVPFKGDAAVELGVRKLLQVAVEHGYDRVVLPRSEQAAQAASAQNVRAVDWKLVPGGIEITPTKGYQAGSPRIFKGDTETVLKTLAKRIGQEPADSIRQWMENGHKSGREDGLDVPNFGMQRQYDEVIPNYAAKYVKKLGGEVRREVVFGSDDFDLETGATKENASAFWREFQKRHEAMPRTPIAGYHEAFANSARMIADAIDREMFGVASTLIRQKHLVVVATEGYAVQGDYVAGIYRKVEKGPQNVVIHITPKMADAIRQGQPLYRQPAEPGQRKVEPEGYWNARERTIGIALAKGDPLRTFYEEAAHALSPYGANLLRKAELGLLEQTARDEGWIEKHVPNAELYRQVYKGHADVEQRLLHEAIGKAFADYALHRDRAGIPDQARPLFDRIRLFYLRTRLALGDRGALKVSDIFGGMYGGGVGARGAPARRIRFVDLLPAAAGVTELIRFDDLIPQAPRPGAKAALGKMEPIGAGALVTFDDLIPAARSTYR